jgi:dihydroflavonol-4-reductase
MGLGDGIGILNINMDLITDKGKSILVTGGTGLLGSHLIWHLVSAGTRVKATYRRNNRERVRKVFGYYSQNPDELYQSIEWIECDSCNYGCLKAAMEGITHVYNCASIVNFSRDESDKVISNNLSATSNIVEACLEAGIKKLCHVSSVATIGATDGNLAADETLGFDPDGDHHAYGRSKYLSEESVWNGISRGLNAVIVNPSIILGPGFWKTGSSALFTTAARGFMFYTDGIKSYVDVNDVAKVMILLMESDISGERFLVASGNLGTREFFNLVAESVGIKGPNIKIPFFLSPVINIAADVLQFLTRQKFPLTRDILKVAWNKVGYDNSKISNYTGYTFTPLQETIRNIAGFYLDDFKSGQLS